MGLYEASVWVATSDDVDGLAIEASTMDALIERLKIVIPELMKANHSELAWDKLPFYQVNIIIKKAA